MATKCPFNRTGTLSFLILAGADPRFTVGGGANLPVMTSTCKFSQKLHEIKKILVRRGDPLDPPLLGKKSQNFGLNADLNQYRNSYESLMILEKGKSIYRMLKLLSLMRNAVSMKSYLKQKDLFLCFLQCKLVLQKFLERNLQIALSTFYNSTVDLNNFFGKELLIIL